MRTLQRRRTVERDASPQELVKIQFIARQSEKQFKRSNSSQHLRPQRGQTLSHQLKWTPSDSYPSICDGKGTALINNAKVSLSEIVRLVGMTARRLLSARGKNARPLPSGMSALEDRLASKQQRRLGCGLLFRP